MPCRIRGRTQIAAASRGRLWHSEDMKALKSKLASELLADRTAKGQLREFLMNQDIDSSREQPSRIEIRSASGKVFHPTVVPKAVKAS